MAEQDALSGVTKAETKGPAPLTNRNRLVTQYIKDLSFENPNVFALLSGVGESPHLDVEVNIEADEKAEGFYECELIVSATAMGKDQLVYELELRYAGIFNTQGLNNDEIERLTMVNGPTLMFPFLRRLAADLTREGGYPPMLMDAIDFEELFEARKRNEAKGAPTSAREADPAVA